MDDEAIYWFILNMNLPLLDRFVELSRATQGTMMPMSPREVQEAYHRERARRHTGLVPE